MNKFLAKCLILFLLLGITACRQKTLTALDSIKLLEESPVLEIPLEGPISNPQAEISGMSWCGEHLILLPQYPERFKVGETMHVFSIPAESIHAFLTGETNQTIEPDMMPLDTAGLERRIKGFEGYESIAFYGDHFFMTIEARQGEGMVGYLVRGKVEGQYERLVIEESVEVALPAQAPIGNISDESLLIYNDLVYTIYEANGVNVNPDPVAHQFDLSLETSTDVPMAEIEYRVTDATAPDQTGTFWSINYFYPGDTKLDPGQDQIAETYGLGADHQNANQVERLIAFMLQENGIVLAEVPPIYLDLSGEISRNWEGIVRFEDGFLIVTDKYPSTILGFVKYVENLP